MSHDGLKRAAGIRLTRRQSNVITPVWCALAVYAVACLAHRAHWAWWAFPVAGVAVTLVARGVMVRHAVITNLVAWATWGLLGLAVWLAWTSGTAPWIPPAAPWHQWPLTAYLVLFAYCWPWYGWVRSPKPPAMLNRAPIRNAKAAELLNPWEQAFRSVGIAWVRVVGPPVHAPNAFTIMLRLLPGSGHTIAQVQAARKALEVAARQRVGSIEFHPGKTADLIEMRVVPTDIMAETIPLPDEHGPLSINDPLALGLFANAKHLSITFREISGGIFGMRRGGKTNLLDVLLSLFGRCQDAVVWVIDTAKGSQFSVPWVQDWLRRLHEWETCTDGSVPHPGRPVIDYLAVDDAGVARLLYDAYLFLHVRSARQAGKIIPSWLVPAILILIDEITSVVTCTERITTHDGRKWYVDQLIKEIIRLGGGAGMDVVFGAQRATSSMIGPNAGGDLKSQLDLKIALKCATRADVAHVFGEAVGDQVDPSKFGHPGVALVQVHQGGALMAAKCWHVNRDGDPGLIGRLAALREPLRPELEPDLVAAARYYRDRWTPEVSSSVRGMVLKHVIPAPDTARPEKGTTVTDPASNAAPVSDAVGDMTSAVHAELAKADAALAASDPAVYKVMQQIRQRRAQGDQAPAATPQPQAATPPPTRTPTVQPPTFTSTQTLGDAVLDAVRQAVGADNRPVSKARIIELVAAAGVQASTGSVSNQLTALTREGGPLVRAGHGHYALAPAAANR